MQNKQQEILHAVSKNIRKLRAENELSIKQMAEKLNISTTAYTNIEKGRTDISIKRIVEIAEILEISFTKVINVEGNINGYTQNNSTGDVNHLNNNAIYHQSEKERELYEKLLQARDIEIAHLKSKLTL